MKRASRAKALDKHRSQQHHASELRAGEGQVEEAVGRHELVPGHQGGDAGGIGGGEELAQRGEAQVDRINEPHVRAYQNKGQTDPHAQDAGGHEHGSFAPAVHQQPRHQPEEHRRKNIGQHQEGALDGGTRLRYHQHQEGEQGGILSGVGEDLGQPEKPEAPDAEDGGIGPLEATSQTWTYAPNAFHIRLRPAPSGASSGRPPTVLPPGWQPPPR